MSKIIVLDRDLAYRLQNICREPQLGSVEDQARKMQKLLFDLNKVVVECATPTEVQMSVGTPIDVKRRDMEVPVFLSVFGWHLLLRELEHAMRVIGRDKKNLEALWTNIGNQLNGTPEKTQEGEEYESASNAKS